MMPKLGVLLACLFCFLCIPIVDAQEAFSCTDITQIPTVECEALVALYNSTDAKQGWLQTDRPCSWEGVECSSSKRNVVTLRKTGASLSREVPPEIGNLTHLTMLWLSGNLTTIPPEIGNLTRLKSLYLHDNQLTAIPPEIGNLTNLTKLVLGGNQLTTIPPEIGNLTKLTRLDLQRNRLTTIPPEIGNLKKLADLTLFHNQLTTLPPEIGDLTNLTDLHLFDNELETLPPEIVNLTNLDTIHLSRDECVKANRAIVERWNTQIGEVNSSQETFLGGVYSDGGIIESCDVKSMEIATYVLSAVAVAVAYGIHFIMTKRKRRDESQLASSIHFPKK